MGIKVKKQERETTQSLIRRFTKAVKNSGLLIRARKRRFKQREKSETMKKKAAQRREEMRKKYEILKKLGKLPE